MPASTPARRWRASIRATAVTAVATVLAAALGVIAAPPAAAADPGIASIASTLAGASNSVQAWTQTLGEIGKLADSLPGVPASPGSVLGFGDLLDQIFDDADGHEAIAAATSVSDLDFADRNIDLGDGRTATVTSDVETIDGADKQVTLTIEARRTASDQPMSIPLPIGSGDAAQSAFTSTGGVDLEVVATFGLRLVWDAATDTVSLVADGTYPSIGLNANAHIEDIGAVNAALGILGVSLVDGSELNLDANFAATIADPNNDGRLSFVEPDASAGELAQADSLSGLVDIGWGSPAGTLSGELILNAAPATSGIALPAVNATIGVQWDDISMGTPTITPTGIEGAGKFLNMTPRDLADGIGQLVTSLNSIQRANIANLDLPFVKGSLADAVRISEVLAEFLSENITTAEEDPVRAGTPDFVSLQEFFDAIDAADIDITGGSIGVSDVNWVDADSKLDFTLSFGRTGSDPQPLSAAAAAASGGAGSTYGPDTLTDTSQAWEPGELVGFRVVAGSSAGTVASNTSTTITLEDDWTPVEPEDGVAYSISAMQGDVGTVQLGDALKTGDGDAARGISEANAVNATATVTPEYGASVTLVLDLQPPVVHDPPIEVENPDGTTYVTSVTPIGADRVLLRTGDTELFHASFPIDADIDIFANAGFFQVRLEGDAHVVAAGGADDMLTIDLKDNGDLTFGQVIDFLLDDADTVDEPGDLLDVDINVGGNGALDVSVPEADEFLQGGTAQASFTWDDITVGTPTFDVSDLTELVDLDFDPSNPKALFSIILKTLQTLQSVLSDAAPDSAAAEVFNEEIPLVGRSLADLLHADESGAGPAVTYGANTLTDATRDDDDGKPFTDALVGRSIIAGTQIGVVASVTATTLTMTESWTTQPATGTPYTMRTELDDAISILEAAPSDNIQELVRQLNDRLGGSGLEFAYEEIDSVPSIILRLAWARDYATSSPVQFDFDLGGDAFSLAGVQGEGNVALDVDGNIDLGLVVPLAAGAGPADADALKILDDSSIGVGLDASITDAYLATNLGPLSISLGDPDAGATDRAQAVGSYSIDLAKETTSGAAVSFSDFLGEVGVEVNQSSNAVECDGLEDVATPLALCATLPLYISTDDGATYNKLIDPGANSFNLRLPKEGETIAELFDISPTAPQIDGHPRLETPDQAALLAAIQNALLNFTDLGSIDSYLQLIEQALRTASFGGKLPLVGEDLQQGADFVGSLRTALQTALGDASVHADMGSTEAVRTWVNDVLASQLGEHNPANVNLSFECPALGTPTNFTVAAGDGTADDDITYRYKVVAYQHDGDGNLQETIAADAVFTDGPTAIDGSNTLVLDWDEVPYAEGYRVFRETAPSDFRLLADIPEGGGDETAHTDGATVVSGTDTPQNPAENPPANDCDYDQVDGIQINLDVSQGTFGVDGLLDCENAPDAAHECLVDEEVPLDIGIPGLYLRGKDGEGPHVQVGYQLHFGFGLNKDDGFFIDAGTAGDPAELSVGLNFTLPAEINAQLAFINITARDCTNAPADLAENAPNCSIDSPAPGAAPPAFGGAFHIDVDDGADNDGHLTIAELSGASFDSLIDVGLQADAQIDWLLKATIGVGDEDIAGFPGIQAEFKLDWSWNDEAPEVTLPTVGFYNVAIDAGEVFGKVLGPIVNKIKAVTNPLDPVIKTLYAPIPVLSDLSRLAGGDDVTLVTLAKTFNTLAGGPDLTFVETIIGVVDFINNLPTCTATCLIPIGDFVLHSDKAVNTTATPDNTQSLIDTGSPDTNVDAGVSGAGGAIGALNSKSSSGGDLGAEGSDTPSAKAGFSFPVFENPASLFNLLLGGDVDLVKFDSGNLTLGFDWRQSFGPVYAPPPVNITLHGSASVTLRIVAGFDTYGIRTAFERAREGEFDLADIGNVFLQSLFFYTTEDGKPLPVVTFTGEIAAGAEVSAIIIKVGIEGGVGLTVSFLWNDPNHDGKFRISEFLAAALRNPICLFTVSGRIYVFLRAYVTIGFSPFEVSFSFTIVDVTLLDFSVAPDCDPPPPELAGVHDGGADGHTLVVYAAALDDPRGPDYVDQEAEKIKITSLHDYDSDGNTTVAGVAVQMLGIRREYRNPNIVRVVVDGRGYGGRMSVVFIGDGKPVKTDEVDEDDDNPPTAQFELDAIVFGGSNADVIKTGIGTSIIDGGGGDDTIVTGDRTVLNAGKTDYLRPDAYAWVAGGPGVDSISVGNGNDIVAGDSAIGVPANASLSAQEIVNDERDGGDPIDGDDGNQPGSDHDDTTSVSVPDWAQLTAPGTGEDGGDGDDTLKAGLGDTDIYGNGGRDTLGVATDSPLADVYPADADLYESQGTYLVGGTGNDSFAGGAHDDVIVTGPDAGGLDTDPDADGGSDDGSTNTVDTGTGSDIVYGSTGVDNVIGHSQYDESVNIRGGAANDVLVGGYGEDTVFGGPGDDYVIAEPSEVGEPGPDDGYGPSRTVTHQELPAGVEPNFKVLVGGTGNDHIVGGDGGADIDGDGYNPTDRCEPGDPVASDPVDESVNLAADGNDRIVGGAGVENVRAGGGNDLAEVKASDDAVCGESGGDTLRGNADDDDVWGGTGDDVLDGDGGDDHLYGNDGEDTIYGDGGADTIEGNDDHDWASGGDDGDVILGGTRAEDRGDTGDDLFGDTGDDIVIGDNGDIVGPRWYPIDLDGATATAGGSDNVYGGSANDRLYGGLAGDDIFGGSGDDDIEGNNADDTIYGESGADDIIGGSSEIPSDTGLDSVGRPDAGDVISGGDGDDVITGDNAVVVAVVSDGHRATRGRGLSTERTVRLLDLGYTPAAGTSGGDTIDGDGTADVVFGQAGADIIDGGNDEDYLEGGQDGDTITGGTGGDDIVGGSSTIESGSVAAQTAAGQLDTGDTIDGENGGDVIIGDNGIVHRAIPPATASVLTTNRAITPRAIDLYDLGDAPVANTSGSDDIEGGDEADVIAGQSGNDRIKGEAGQDYAEGGPGADWIEGNASDDDLVGGSSTIRTGTSGDAAAGQPDTADSLWGGGGDDVITGDNGFVTRNTPYSELTNRIGSLAAIETRRSLQLLDLLNDDSLLTAPPATRFGGDQLSGGSGVDVMFGQDGPDRMAGGHDDDYAEGNGADDKIWGDISLLAAGIPPQADPGWPGAASGEPTLSGVSSVHGQDDLLGGSSRQGFRDAGDEIHGDGAADYELGDNGTVRRIPQGEPGSMVNKPYALRYPTPTPASAASVRIPAAGEFSTRYCPIVAGRCEVGGAFGPDSMFGDGGDDTMYGQDADDLMWGGDADDDMYGEMGADRLSGENGDDAMSGDRGGFVDRYEDGSRAASAVYDNSQVPKIHFEGFLAGTVTRQFDLQHDVNGDAFVDNAGNVITTQAVPPAAMPLDGLAFGGNDRLRGGNGHDSMHGGVGDDLMNGDSGGDILFGDNGADALWGGKGCDPAVDTEAASPDCYTGGVLDVNARGTKDRMVDYILGGKGATSGPSVDPTTGALGSDVIDWRPRGSADSPGTTCSTTAEWPVTSGPRKNPFTIDPCSWFEMTDITAGDNPADNQHHQGIDWQYGGWDRDILQADVADNGPNQGDRLMDWNGAYNLYTHCNSAYGGFNDVRQHSPAHQSFLQLWTYALGGGQVAADAKTAGRSAFVELALVYPGADNAHGSGSAYPSTPGHFDNPNACAP